MYRFTTFLLAGIAILTLAACGGGGGGGDETFATATAQSLGDRSFPIAADQGLFDATDPRFGQGATITFGTFAGTTAPFSVVSDDGSVQGGTVTLGSCTVTTTFLALAGEDPQAVDPPEVDVFDPCDVSDEGRLRLVDDEGTEFLSSGATDLEPLLAFDVDLSPANEVPPLVGRTETGTFTMALLPGGVLEYTIDVVGLQAGDELTIAHIHEGGSTENGGILITLVNQPVQFGRTTNILFDGGTTVSAAISLTGDEVETLLDAEVPLYVNIHSAQQGAGLVRAQLRDAAPTTAPTADAGADQAVTEGDAVTLDASQSTDSDGTIASYAWTQTAGPTVTLSDDTVAQPTFTAPQVGAAGATLTFEVMVTDNDALTDNDSVTVTVNDTQVVPVSFAEQIQPIYTTNCAKSGCHAGLSPQAGMNLEAGQAYANLVNVPSTEQPAMDRVEPGDAANSYIYRKHTGAAGISGSRMPADNPTFFDSNPELLALEQRWIEEGANNN